MDEEKKKQKRMDRYEKVFNDPKFKPIPKKVHKVELNDNRFNSMFENKDFYSTSKIDKYGNINKQKNFKEQLEDYYIKNDEKSKKIKKEKNINLKEENEENEEEESESDTSEEFQEYLKNMNEQNAEILKDEENEEKIPTGEETSRIAIQNIDWSTIHALDLFILLNSFCKGNQKVLKVEIYPSEYGMKEMAKENELGPDKQIFTSEAIVKTANNEQEKNTEKNNNKKNQEKENKNSVKKENSKNKNSKEEENSKNENSENDNQENSEKENENSEKEEKENEEEEEDEEEEENYDSSNEGFDAVELRKYELKKLKYYYAIVYCDSVATASSLYNECDGLEIERTQSFLDMRFVPDTLTKFPYAPKETCDHIPANSDYTPNFKPNSALQDTKVKLTWDEGDPRRADLISRAFHKEGFNEEEINELLVSSDSEDEDLKNELEGSDEDMGLNLLKKKRKMPKFKDGETIEIKFNKGFEGISNEVKKEEKNEKENKSKWEEFKERKKNIRKEKKKEEREKKNKIKENRKNEFKNKEKYKDEMDLLVEDKTNMKEFKFNEKDERFQTKNNVDFAIDPTNKNYKKMKGRKNY